MNRSYRYVLRTSLGPFFSEPTTTYREVKEVWSGLGAASGLLERIEFNDGSGWETL